MTLPKNVRVFHIRNIQNPNQVLTIAETYNPDDKLDGKACATTTFGWSLNKPTHWVTYKGPDRIIMDKIKGDAFNRDKGRMIAMGRMSTARSQVTLEVRTGERPIDAIMANLVTSVDTQISQIARDWLCGVKPSKGDSDQLRMFEATRASRARANAAVLGGVTQ